MRELNTGQAETVPNTPGIAELHLLRVVFFVLRKVQQGGRFDRYSMPAATHAQFAVNETTASRRGLSSLNKRPLTTLLVTLLAVNVVMVVTVIVLTVGIGVYRSTPPHHSMGMLVSSNLAGTHDALVPRSNARIALPTQPVVAARDLVHAVVGTQLPCYPHDVKQWYLQSLGCPVTPQFRRYLLAHMRDVDPICQCQNYAIHNTFRLVFQRAGLAAVAATLAFAYNTVYIVFVEVNRGRGWLVTANYVTHIKRSSGADKEGANSERAFGNSGRPEDVSSNSVVMRKVVRLEA